MANAIPDSLKAGLPDTKWGKVLGATPVVLTVVATLLAGLSNGEMTRAQYSRSLAAQLQAKAGDQWGFFQAKRLRGAVQSAALDAAQLAGADLAPNVDALRAFAATLPEPAAARSALDQLASGRLPDNGRPAPLDARVQAILDAGEQGLAETELAARLRAAPEPVVADAVRAAQARLREFDTHLAPTVTHGDRLGDAIDAAQRKDLARDFAVLRLRTSSLRYDAEAALNRAVAAIYEVQVKQANLAAERHQRRSGRFFYGMLGAQAGVVIATFAMAARQKNLLWSLAATAGLCAVSFAAYVFLFL